MRGGDRPNTPTVWFQRADLLGVEFVRDFPHQSCPAIVGSDHKGVAVAARLSLKICDFPKRESVNRNSTDDLKTMIDRSPCWPCNESGLILRGARDSVVNCKWSSDWDRRFLFLVVHGRNATTASMLSQREGWRKRALP